MSNYMYIFIGEEASFPSGVFSDYEKAVNWIKANSLNGVLNKYPVDISVYDWAIDKEYFEVKRDYQTSSKFIQKFTTASMEHWHFEDGLEQ